MQTIYDTDDDDFQEETNHAGQPAFDWCYEFHHRQLESRNHPFRSIINGFHVIGTQQPFYLEDEEKSNKEIVEQEDNTVKYDESSSSEDDENEGEKQIEDYPAVDISSSQKETSPFTDISPSFKEPEFISEESIDSKKEDISLFAILQVKNDDTSKLHTEEIVFKADVLEVEIGRASCRERVSSPV